MSSEKLKTHFTVVVVGKRSIENHLRFGKNSPVRIREEGLGRAIAGAQHSPSHARAVVPAEVPRKSHHVCFSQNELRVVSLNKTALLTSFCWLSGLEALI